MKIIVDEMPNEPKECIFSECTNQLHGNYTCNLCQGRGCEPDRCRFFNTGEKHSHPKSVTDYMNWFNPLLMKKVLLSLSAKSVKTTMYIVLCLHHQRFQLLRS